MSKHKILTLVGLAGVLLTTSNAVAEETSAESKTQETKLIKAENTTVLGAVELNNVVPVTDNQGNVFYNHYVPEEDLYDASVTHETVDTYTYEYKGRLYTNKIVTD